MRLFPKVNFSDVSFRTDCFPLENELKQQYRIYEPASDEELTCLLDFAHRQNLDVKLLKRNCIQLTKNFFSTGSFFIDLFTFDDIIDYSKNSQVLRFKPGLSDNQLQEFLLQNKELRPLSIKQLLLNELVFKHLDHSANDVLPAITNQLKLKSRPKDCHDNIMIFSFDSIASVFTAFESILSVKNTFGDMLRDLFLINSETRNAFLSCIQNKLYHKKELKKIYHSLKNFNWHLIINIECCNSLVNSVKLTAKQLLTNYSYHTHTIQHQQPLLTRGFQGPAIKFKPRHRSSLLLTEEMDIDSNFMIYKYHAIYKQIKRKNVRPSILFDFNRTHALKLYVKNYYDEENSFSKMKNFNFYNNLLENL